MAITQMHNVGNREVNLTNKKEGKKERGRPSQSLRVGWRLDEEGTCIPSVLLSGENGKQIGKIFSPPKTKRFVLRKVQSQLTTNILKMWTATQRNLSAARKIVPNKSTFVCWAHFR